MIKILINGCNGKMGQVVSDLATSNSEEFEVVAGFDKEAKDYSYPVYTNINDIKEIPDVIIDFSIPKATFAILEYAKEKKIPIVIATTGFSDEELKTIEEYSTELKETHAPKSEEIDFAPKKEYMGLVNIYKRGLEGKDVEDQVQDKLTICEWTERAYNLVKDKIDSTVPGDSGNL